jgi:hypothetical protein
VLAEWRERPEACEDAPKALNEESASVREGVVALSSSSESYLPHEIACRRTHVLAISAMRQRATFDAVQARAQFMCGSLIVNIESRRAVQRSPGV